MYLLPLFREVDLIFTTHLMALHGTYCTPPSFSFFHCSGQLVSLSFICAPTLMQARFDTFSHRLLNPLQPLIILLCLCVRFCFGRHLQKELKVKEMTTLAPMLFVFAQTECAD